MKIWWRKLLRFVANVVSLLPRGLLYRLSDLCGLAAYFLARDARGNVEHNMRVMLGDTATKAQIDEHVASAFKALCRYLVVLCAWPVIGRRLLREDVTCDGFEAFADLARRSGAIVVSAHTCDPFVAHRFFDSCGLPGATIISPEFADLLSSLMSPRYRMECVTYTAVGQIQRKFLRSLRDRGAILALAGDRLLGDKGIRVRVFGHEMYLSKGPARLALMAGVPLVPAFLRREGYDRYRMTVLPPIDLPSVGTMREKIEYLTNRYATRLEQIVRTQPDQWLLFYRLFENSHELPSDPARLSHERHVSAQT